jgi:hypothetical protein
MYFKHISKNIFMLMEKMESFTFTFGSVEVMINQKAKFLQMWN